MNIFLTAGLAAISMVFYNLFQKITPSNANPALALSVTYGVALVVTLATFSIFPVGNLSLAFKNLNGASFALGVAVAGVEIATLLAYRSGWQISLLAISINVTAALILFILKPGQNSLNLPQSLTEQHPLLLNIDQDQPRQADEDPKDIHQG